MIKSYRDIIAWQRSIELAENIYELTRILPKEELYGLSSQMRRAAVSIPSNIAEGYGRRSVNDYIRFLNIALGSSYELETQLELCQRLGYFDKHDCARTLELCNESGRLINGLIIKLSNAQN